jgi:hypothetical protein
MEGFALKMTVVTLAHSPCSFIIGHMLKLHHCRLILMDLVFYKIMRLQKIRYNIYIYISTYVIYLYVLRDI